MRRPFYLAIVGVSIVVSAVAVGATLTRYLSLLSYSPKAPQGTASVAAESGSAPPPVEEWQNPFSPSQGMKIPSRLPAAAGNPTAPASRTNFLLVGTIVSSTPSARRAILWAEGMKEPKAYREGEEVEPGAVLASVERDKAWLVRESEREKLELLPVGSKARPTAAPGAPRPAAAQLSPLPASPPSGVALPGPEGAGDEEESRGRSTSRIQRPGLSRPPAGVASPAPAQSGDDERPRIRTKRRQD